MIFTGIGNAFNTAVGNTSAYIKNGKSIFILDCGSLVFKTLKESDVLEGIKDINIAITHMHPDHAGSLGDLIFYCYYIHGLKPNIYFPPTKTMKEFLNIIGVADEIYNLHDGYQHQIQLEEECLQISFVKSEHVVFMDSFSLLLSNKTSQIYYSGDALHIETKYIEMLKHNELQYIFQDICKGSGDMVVHMPLQELIDRIPLNLRHKVYCMHFEDQSMIDTAKASGFLVVETNKSYWFDS